MLLLLFYIAVSLGPPVGPLFDRSPSPPVTHAKPKHAQSEVQSADFTE